MADIGLPKTIPDRGLNSIQSMTSSMKVKVWKEARATPEASPGFPPPGLQVPGISFNKDAPELNKDAPEFVPGLFPPPGCDIFGVETDEGVMWVMVPNLQTDLAFTENSRKWRELLDLDEATNHACPRRSTAMAASSRGLEGVSDKQGSAVNKNKLKSLANAKLATQPSAAKKSEEECGGIPGHMPQFQEENRHIIMPSHMPHSLEEANMHDVPRSSNAMAAPSQGFEGDIDKQARTGTDHQEKPNQEESTHGSDAGAGNEGNHAEGHSNGNEIGIGQAHQHGRKKQKGCRQRQRSKKYWRNLSPERPYPKTNLPISDMV